MTTIAFLDTFAPQLGAIIAGLLMLGWVAVQSRRERADLRRTGRRPRRWAHPRGVREYRRGVTAGRGRR